jgi:hypothetical protein
MSTRTPLALFVYNRPAHTARALAAIARLERLDEVDLHFFCDAPKREAHAAAVEETRAVVSEFARAGRAEVILRSENLGLAKSIGGSVSALTAAYGRVVVLEDDLVPTPDFLPFMLEGLDRFEADNRVLQISGCLLPGRVVAPADGFLLPLTTTWGWATWARAWQAFRPAIGPEDRAALETDRSLRHRFTAEGSVDYVAMLDDRIQGRNDSWGILWWHAVAKASGLVLYPRESLIWNGGFDASGVHCGGDEVFQPEAPPLFRARRLPDPIRLPPPGAEADAAAWAAVLAYLRGGVAGEGAAMPQVSWLGRAKRAARRLLKG